MNLAAILYLFQIYWPFLVIALLIGIATGWYSYTDQSESGGKA